LLGTYRQWEPSQEDEHMIRRQMVYELKERNHEVLGEVVMPFEEPCQPVTEVSTALDADIPPFIFRLVHDDGPRYDVWGGCATNDSVTEHSNDVAGMSVPSEGWEHNAPVPLPSHSQNGIDVSAKPSLASNCRTFQGSDSDEDTEVSDPYRITAVPQGHVEFGGNATRPDSIKEGWVWKQSRYLKRWRRRWLVLTPHTLQSYKKRSDRNPTEIIKGALVRCGVPESNITHQKTFCVGVDKRTFVMVSDTEGEKDEWIESISKTLKK